MSNELMIFENENFGKVRMVEVNGKPYAVGSDVAECLGYKRPSKAVSDHCKGILKQDTFKNDGGYPEKLISQGDILRLVVKCPLPEADKFENWIFDEVIPQVLNAGRFDVMENKLQQIEDEKEKELSLGLYSMKQALKNNPNDYTLSILCNNKEIELKQYKQDKQLEEVNEKIKLIENNQKEHQEKLDNMFTIGDRVEFRNEINAIVRATGKKHNEVYTLTYKKLKDIYGIDLEQRSKNAKEKIQENRLDSGKKPYSPQTLDNKAGKLVIAEELDIFNELGKALNAVKNDLLNN